MTASMIFTLIAEAGPRVYVWSADALDRLDQLGPVPARSGLLLLRRLLGFRLCGFRLRSCCLGLRRLGG
jgi:hypothetical protein